MPVFAGRLLMEDEVVVGWLEVEDGRCVDWGDDKPPAPPVARGWIVPAPVNAHTHGADTFLRDRPGKPATVAELVGPGGWKAQQLAAAKPEDLTAGFHRYADEMAAIGTARFLDFREGGLEGVRMLRALANDLPVDPLVYGRPLKRDFKDDEALALLREVDGIGLSALRDFPEPSDVEAWAHACHRAGKWFALHASEARQEDMDALLALEPDFLVHCTKATSSDLTAMADSDVVAVVCPRSNAHYGMKTPLDRMLDAEVTVAVGTDNGMLQDGNLLSELAQLHSWFPRAPVETLLRMATWNSRRLAGLAGGLPPRKGQPLDVIVLPDRPWKAAESGKPGFALPASNAELEGDHRTPP